MKHALSETRRLVASFDNMSSSRCCRPHQQKSEEGHVLGNLCLSTGPDKVRNLGQQAGSLS